MASGLYYKQKYDLDYQLQTMKPKPSGRKRDVKLSLKKIKGYLWFVLSFVDVESPSSSVGRAPDS